MVVHNGKEVLSVEEKRLAQDRERKVVSISDGVGVCEGDLDSAVVMRW
jgi:hypothetical protein